MIIVISVKEVVYSTHMYVRLPGVVEGSGGSTGETGHMCDTGCYHKSWDLHSRCDILADEKCTRSISCHVVTARLS